MGLDIGKQCTVQCMWKNTITGSIRPTVYSRAHILSQKRASLGLIICRGFKHGTFRMNNMYIFFNQHRFESNPLQKRPSFWFLYLHVLDSEHGLRKFEWTGSVRRDTRDRAGVGTVIFLISWPWHTEMWYTHLRCREGRTGAHVDEIVTSNHAEPKCCLQYPRQHRILGRN